MLLTVELAYWETRTSRSQIWSLERGVHTIRADRPLCFECTYLSFFFFLFFLFSFLSFLLIFSCQRIRISLIVLSGCLYLCRFAERSDVVEKWMKKEEGIH